MSVPAVSVVVPTYNEEGNIVVVLEGLRRSLAGRDYEIFVVDDDSPDETAREARTVAAADPRIEVIVRTEKPRDLARSVALGFSRARGAALASINADGSHDPADLPRLLDALAGGAEAAIGSRYAPGGRIEDWPASRRLLSAAGTFAARTVLGLAARDPLSGYYAFTRAAWERAGGVPQARGFKVLMEVLARARPSVAEVPIVFRDRRRGASKMGAGAALRALGSLVRLRFSSLE